MGSSMLLARLAASRTRIAGSSKDGGGEPEVSRRLVAVGAAFALIFVIAILLFNVVGPLLGTMPEQRRLIWPMPGNLIALTGMVASLALIGMARRFRDQPTLLRQAGSAYLVLICFLFGLVSFWVPRLDLAVPSWVGLAIVGYVGLVPTDPRSTGITVLVAATMAPVALIVVALAGREVHATPFEYLLAFFPNYLCAGLAIVHAKLIRRLGRQVKEARELGSYRLEELLSQGGMGEVYRASHQMLARPAAIKLILPEKLGSQSPDYARILRERFRREAEAVASLGSPHTINLYDFGVAEDGRLFLVMELLDGLDLESLILRHGPLSPARSVHLLRQACHSLEEAHARGMIHRDIKPSNIFVCRMGLTVDFVKVLDFGLVRERTDSDARLTAPNRTAGTPSYMAPEMVLNGEDIDHRADIYALGCVAYWLLTGRTVFQGSSTVDLLLQHVHVTPTPLSDRGEFAIPAALEAVVLECLAKSPADRPQSAGELSRRLAAALGDGSTWSEPEAANWWRNNRPVSSRAESEVTTQPAQSTTAESGETLSPSKPATSKQPDPERDSDFGSLITSMQQEGHRSMSRPRLSSHPSRKLLGASLIFFLALLPGSARAQRPAAAFKVGVVLDGPSSTADSARAVLEQEVIAFGAGPGVEFPARFRTTGDYTVTGVDAAIDRLLADRDVDLVLALGPIGSHQLARRKNLAKPVIATLVIDAGVQELPNVNGVSGVKNLSYIDVAFPMARTFEVFRQVVPYHKLAILVHPGVPAAMPGLAIKAQQDARAHGSTVILIPVTSSADQVLKAIPSDVDAVYLAPVEQLLASGIDSLFRGLIARKLPVFTLAGRQAVERGALLSYASEDDLVRRARRVASTILRIHNGEDAGSLPVSLASVSQLTINLATARAIGFSPGWDVMTDAVLINQEAPASGPVWNLSGVGRQAVLSNLDLKAATQAVTTSAEDKRIGRSGLLPQVQAEATGTAIREKTAAASLGQHAQREAGGKLVFSQAIYDDAAWASYRISQYQEKGSYAERRRTELEVVLRATVAYLNVLRTKAIARVERENLSLTRSNLDVAQLKERVGASGLSDVYRWQAELAQSRRRVLDSDANMQVAALELNSVLNRPLEEAFQTSDAGTDDPSLLISEPKLLGYLANPATFALFRDFSVQEGVKASPEVQGIELQIVSEQRRGTSARRSMFLPTVTLEGGASSVLGRDGSGAEPPTIAGLTIPRGPDETWSLQLKATLPLFSGLAQQAQAARANSEVERLKVSRQSAALGISQQIRAALQRAAASWANIAQARLAAEAAKKNLDLVTDAYGRGAVNVITLLDAQQSALESNEAAANAVYDFLIDLMNAQRASGRFDFFYTAEERSDYYQRLDAFYQAAGQTPVVR